MGPNDPFETLERRPERADGERRPFLDTLSNTRMPQDHTMKRLAPLVGLALGVLFGILMMAYGLTGALLIYLLGGLGSFLGWLGYGIAAGRFDVVAAWRALRRQDPGRFP